MFVSPNNRLDTTAPREFQDRARAHIHERLATERATKQRAKLKHGESPLRNLVSADSDGSSVHSGESAGSDDRRWWKKWGRNKERRGSGSSVGSSDDKTASPLSGRVDGAAEMDAEMDAEMEVDPDEGQELLLPELISGSALAPLTHTPTYTSAITASSYADSLFSHTSRHTRSTAYSQPSVGPQTPCVSLQAVLPTDFSLYYPPLVFSDPSISLNADGRPLFTQRDLIDWRLNDLRLLLIMDTIPAEWERLSELPVVIEVSEDKRLMMALRIQYLPLDASNDWIVKVLVESDIYRESNFSTSFRVQTASYSLQAARLKHAQDHPDGKVFLTRPEWRNVIENFLLNLAVESQCRYEFKRVCSRLLKERRGLVRATDGLLRRALLNDPGKRTKASREERQEIWCRIQTSVYQRLGLDWQPDGSAR